MDNLSNLGGYTGPPQTPGLAIALVIGNVISFCLYGALTVQIYIYYTTFTGDSKKSKAIVCIIYIMETVYTVMLAYYLMDLVLDHDYNTGPISLLIPIGGGMVALLTQAVYAHRTRVIAGMTLIPLFFVALMAMELLTTAILIPLKISFFLIALVWSACSLCADLAFATIIVRTLTKDKILSRVLRRRVERLVYLIVGCGILTVAINIVTLVASVWSFDLTMCCGIVLSKIYANGMMVLLNDRIYFQSRDELEERKPDDVAMVPDCSIATIKTTGSLSVSEWKHEGKEVV